MNTGVLRGWKPPAAVVPVTAAYGAANGEIILANGTFTVSLPPPVDNAVVSVKNIGTGTVSVVPGAVTQATIDGRVSTVIATQWESHTFVSDGANWFEV